MDKHYSTPLTINKRILSLAPGVSEIDATLQLTQAVLYQAQEFTRLVPGQELGELYGYEYDGCALKPVQKYAPEPNAKPGDPLYADVNGDGLITPADRKDLGNTTPHYTAGFGNDFRYKNFDLNVFFQGAFDYYLYNLNQLVLESTTGVAALNRFVPGVNENTDIPREGYFLSTYGSYINSRFVENASYVRLKSARLSYTFPAQLFQNIKFLQGLNVYVEGQNLLTFTGYKGTDPEENVNAGNNTAGAEDFGGFPAFKTFIVGLKLSVH